MKGGGGDGCDGRGWDGSDVGRSLSFMGGLSSAMSAHPLLMGTHHVHGCLSFICGGLLLSMGGGSCCHGALSCPCWWLPLLSSYLSLTSSCWGSSCLCWWLSCLCW